MEIDEATVVTQGMIENAVWNGGLGHGLSATNLEFAITDKWEGNKLTIVIEVTDKRFEVEQ